jgi:hypothetical protein
MRQGIQASGAGRLASLLAGRTFRPPARKFSSRKSPANNANIFRFQLAEKICESVRADKVLGAGNEALVVSPSTGCSRWCRHADLQLPSGRLKLPLSQSRVKRCTGAYVPPTTHDGESSERKDAPESKSLFGWNLAGLETKHDFVTCLEPYKQRQMQSQRPKREPGKKGVLCLKNFA